jgi:hypothetical protein
MHYLQFVRERNIPNTNWKELSYTFHKYALGAGGVVTFVYE